MLVVTRILSGLSPSARGPGRYALAGVLALLPTTCTSIAIDSLEATSQLAAAASVVTIGPTLAVAGSTFALFFLLVFSHRELDEHAQLVSDLGGTSSPASSET